MLLEANGSSGLPLVFDRYIHSAIAYRAAEDFDSQYVRQVNAAFPRPDIGILLDISVAASLARTDPTKPPTPYATAFLERVRSEYLRLAETGELILIDAERPIADVKADVVRLVLDHVRK